MAAYGKEGGPELVDAPLRAYGDPIEDRVRPEGGHDQGASNELVEVAASLGARAGRDGGPKGATRDELTSARVAGMLVSVSVDESHHEEFRDGHEKESATQTDPQNGNSEA